MLIVDGDNDADDDDDVVDDDDNGGAAHMSLAWSLDQPA